jgi:peptidyl-prolyl cis-trans isomerase A (cyclophilin A)
MTKILMTILSLALVSVTFANDGGKDKEPKMEDGIYAEFTTTKGVIIIKLEHEKVPMTVANFVGLAEGNFTVDSIVYDKPFYDGLLFHRVIADFMVQGGDPDGNGSGGPKHRFADEFDASLKHSGPGVLSMANSGPATNGSQFFITHKATPWLDGKHSVFGYVVSGQDVVNAIATGDTMNTVTILRVGKVAKKWDASAVFAQVILDQTPERQKEILAALKISIPEHEKELAELKEDLAKQKKEKKIAKLKAEIAEFEEHFDKIKAKATELEESLGKAEKEKKQAEYGAMVAAMSQEEFSDYMYAEVLKEYPNAKRSESGLVYVIMDEGTGVKPVKGSGMSVHYRGTFRTSKEQFDASYDRGQPMDFTYLEQRMIPGFEEGMGMIAKGGKAILIIPYYAAYGPQGRPGAIPPYSDLVFEIEMVNVTAPVEGGHEGHDHGPDGHQH